MPAGFNVCFKAITAAAAAIFIAAASAPVWAQIMTQQPAAPQEDSQAPALQTPPLPPPELRGTEAPPLNDLGTDSETQYTDDTNPIYETTPQAGLPPPLSATSNNINYGAPKPKKSKLYQMQKARHPGSPALPSLSAYATAPGMRRQGNSLPANLTDPGPTVAVIPTLPQPLRPKPDLTPFDALGVDVGSLRLYPFVEADTGYESNPNLLSTDIVPSPYIYGQTGMKVESNWSQHSLTADLRGGYYDYFRVPDANRPDVSGTITGRVDVTRQTQINTQTTFSLTTQQPGSPVLAIPNSVFITNRPLFASVGQTLGVTQQFNRLSISLNSAFARYIFGNATQSDGTTLQLSDDNYNDYSLATRASYELTPGLIPYLQVTGDARRHDDQLDIFGFDRNSNGIAGKIGTTFELTQLLTGDIAAGYADRVYADPRLPQLNAPTIDASLIYTATPLTTVTFTAATDLAETTLADASGAVSRTLTLEIAHNLLRNLTLSATGTYQINTYEGQPVVEHFYSGVLKAEYHATRNIVLTGSYTHQRFLSNDAITNYTDDVFLLGLRLQL